MKDLAKYALPNDAADIAGVPPGTLREWITCDRVPVHLWHRKLVVRITDVEKLARHRPQRGRKRNHKS